MRDIVSPLDGFRSPFGPRRGSAAFTPARLFANDEPGVWLDPSDISTLFTDTVGTTPVTTPGQTVALALDKSQGVGYAGGSFTGLGPELVTNGDFSDGSTGWTLNQSAVVDGALVYTPTTSSVIFASQAGGAYQSGKSYILEYDVISNTIPSFSLRINFGSGDIRSLPETVGPNAVKLINVPSNRDVQFETFVNTISGTFVIDNISVRELPGNHATQATAAARPTYQVDANGKGYLSFDGVDDFMVTPTITPGTDKVQVFAGVRKLSDGVQVIAETGVSSSSTGAFYIVVEPTDTRYGFAPRGNRIALYEDQANVTGFAAPDSAVLTTTVNLNDGLPARIRRNGGAYFNSVSTSFGGGNFLAYPMYIGARAGAAFPLNGNLYSLITRFGPNLTTPEIEQVEGYVNSKTGAY